MEDINFFPIEKKNPLKQGLKHYNRNGNVIIFTYWKEESIKTRIETCPKCKKPIMEAVIEERIPLKQELKQYAA